MSDNQNNGQNEHCVTLEVENIEPNNDNKMNEEDEYQLSDHDDYPNDWTPQNEATLKKWLVSITQATDIYQNVLDDKKNIYNKILVVSLIIIFIGTVISAISTVFSGVDKYKTLVLVLNAIGFGINGIVTILNGTIKIYNFDEDIKIFSAYIERLDQFYSPIVAQVLLDPSLRKNAKEFIEVNNKTYVTLIQTAPYIKSSTYRKYKSKYDEYRDNQKLDFKSQTLNDMNGGLVEFN